jgi:hypothetical protein
MPVLRAPMHGISTETPHPNGSVDRESGPRGGARFKHVIFLSKHVAKSGGTRQAAGRRKCEASWAESYKWLNVLKLHVTPKITSKAHENRRPTGPLALYYR